MKIKTFGKIAELTADEITTESDFESVGVLREYLETAYPFLRGMVYRIAVNQRFSSDSDSIEPNAEIALLPPFSGG